MRAASAAGGLATKTPAQVLGHIGGAPLASPQFTGTPKAPTPSAGDKSTRVATTEFVSSALAPVATAAESVAGIVKLATTAQAQALTDDLTALTPKKLAAAFAGSNQLIVANGYQKLPGGLLLQWGIQASAASANTVAHYPISFTGGVLAVFGTGLNTSGGIQAYVTLNSYNTANATFNCFVAGNGSAASLASTVGGVSLRWFAIGKA